ncbi:hypothetical protein BJF79_14035 [Actinomadura sp. CNU-125]|uniref:hypothetical protein n=1 Tax=Actinomadura sp. CNU-125 TaxID=1904961 RepID=UPI0009655CB0|nr:hypothetical protein [Actinomadura sp. CNU-125]OLT24070.1 hypothetical protein BJF79_14035 [Actinomadura sp. CNU-125]
MGRSSRCPGRQEGAAPFGRLGEGAVPTAELEREALSAISTEDVAAFLRTAPPEHVRDLLGVLRLGAARRPPPGAADLLLRTFRHGEPRRRAALRDILAAPALHVFGNVDGLGADDCVRLLDDATAGDVLERAPALRSLLASDVPDTIVRWWLACAVAKGRPLAVVALALLAEPAARAAWDGLRGDRPDLPEHPVELRDLRRIARRPSDTEEKNGTPMPSPPALDDLTAALDELRRRFDEARAGRRPGGRILPGGTAAGRR